MEDKTISIEIKTEVNIVVPMVCAWCGKHIKYTEIAETLVTKFGESATHGICKKCSRKQVKDYHKKTKKIGKTGNKTFFEKIKKILKKGLLFSKNVL